jgi:membrane protein DedA with SNARE-associated domain
MISSLSLLHPIYNQIQSWFLWPYILLAFLVAVEGPLATLGAAIASSTGYLDPKLVFLFASCGNLTADILWYSLGYMGKLDLLDRYGRWFGFKQDIHDHVGKFLFISKLTLGLVVPTLIAAGLARVPWKRWIGLLFIAEFIWTSSLVLIGYFYGSYVLQLEKNMKLVSIGATIIMITGLGLYILYRRSHKDNQ